MAKFKVCLVSFVVSPLISLMAALPAYADDWEVFIEPYIMGTSIKGDSGFGRVDGVPVDISFSDILETLDAAAMIHGEAVHRSGWGVIVDYGFMTLKDDITGERGGIVSAKLKQGVLQIEGLYRQQVNNGTIDYSLGLRHWKNDISLVLSPAEFSQDLNPKLDEEWVDIFVGARWLHRVNQQWTSMLRIDLGGLDADFTSTTQIGAIYSFNKHMKLDIQYRATWVDYQSGERGEQEYFAYDTVTHGPIVGFIYQF